ncbi:hypothetical protein [Bartonella grahamii]|uniref:Uncharacterized protein n=2 Tax=Bartonella grahamii TaxID=33045 RepID=A0A336NGB1_BARGR|nr:hypothetical protein [Bartonella grahamii]ACS50625.1 hypothetical protein Bgr_02620 [Bartonella grahamii as4aup]SSZ40094.1 Uncharacterised protein [Bartonella grahamii]
MNIKYFITAFATFASISIAQGASFLASQNLIQRASSAVPPIGLFSSEQLRKVLYEVFQIELSCTNNSEYITAAKLVPVSHSGKKRGYNPKKGPGKRGRPNLFTRSPMSF